MLNRLAPQLDLTLVADDAPPPPASLVLRHYAVSVVLYGALLALLFLNPWFKSLLRIRAGGVTAGSFYGLLYLAYVVVALPVYLAWRPRSLHNSKNLLLARLLARVWRRAGDWFRRRPAVPLGIPPGPGCLSTATSTGPLVISTKHVRSGASRFTFTCGPNFSRARSINIPPSLRSTSSEFIG